MGTTALHQLQAGLGEVVVAVVEQLHKVDEGDEARCCELSLSIAALSTFFCDERFRDDFGHITIFLSPRHGGKCCEKHREIAKRCPEYIAS